MSMLLTHSLMLVCGFPLCFVLLRSISKQVTMPQRFIKPFLKSHKHAAFTRSDLAVWKEQLSFKVHREYNIIVKFTCSCFQLKTENKLDLWGLQASPDSKLYHAYIFQVTGEVYIVLVCIIYRCCYHKQGCSCGIFPFPLIVATARSWVTSTVVLHEQEHALQGEWQCQSPKGQGSKSGSYPKCTCGLRPHHTASLLKSSRDFHVFYLL